MWEGATGGGLGTEVIAQPGWVAVVLLTSVVLSKSCREGQGQQSMAVACCECTASQHRSINSICHQQVGLLFPS